MTEEQIREAFEKYRRESDPYIGISDAQARWVLNFIIPIVAGK